MTVRCVTLWIGPALGPVERACLRSLLRHGHSLTLYCYQPVAGVPEGVELRDAADLIPESEIIRHHTGSVALFANRFRYLSQQRALGTWVDCDAYFIGKLDGEAPYLFGHQENGTINNGVLRVPPDSPLLPPLLELFEEKSVPPWLPWRSRVAAHLRLRLTGRSGIAKMPWGSLGPIAVTALGRRYGLDHLALPEDVLYPVRWDQAEWVVRSDVRLEDVITPRTISIHLWNERIKHLKDAPAPPGSFLARLQSEGS